MENPDKGLESSTDSAFEVAVVVALLVATDDAVVAKDLIGSSVSKIEFVVDDLFALVGGEKI